jgi:transcriptional regulator with XRE-family HTH domain
VPEPTDLSRRLQRLLAARSCSIAEAARMAGMEKQMAWRIVTGATPDPHVSSVRRLVEGVGGTLGELFADEGDE